MKMLPICGKLKMQRIIAQKVLMVSEIRLNDTVKKLTGFWYYP